LFERCNASLHLVEAFGTTVSKTIEPLAPASSNFNVFFETSLALPAFRVLTLAPMKTGKTCLRSTRDLALLHQLQHVHIGETCVEKSDFAYR
jgi:hypothetical protein